MVGILLNNGAKAMLLAYFSCKDKHKRLNEAA